MSYIVLTRWTPRSIVGSSPGWLSLPQIHAISENAEYGRQLLGPHSKDDLEIQSICVNYINGCLFLRNVIGEDNFIKSYNRISQDSSLVFSMMLVSSEEDWNVGIEGQDWWSYYASARNDLLDLLDVRMETKQYVSNDPDEWNMLISSNIMTLEKIFNTKTGRFVTYP